jgi:hypothetical protein
MKFQNFHNYKTTLYMLQLSNVLLAAPAHGR